MSLDIFKAEGNAAFSAGDYDVAVEKFTQGIDLDSNSHVLYSNRSAAYCSMKRYEDALADAEKAISLSPHWSKGYSRKGAALYGLERHEDAKKAYEEGLAIEPTNAQLKKGVDDCQKAMGGVFANPFSSPDTMARIANDPTTRSYLAQRDFVEKIEEIQRDPKKLSNHLQDTRILQAMMVALGLNAKNQDFYKENETNPNTASSSGEATGKTSKMDGSADPKWDDVRIESEKLKTEGNAAYKQRRFEDALDLYSRAVEVDETNINVYLNISAVYFEQGRYDECVGLCESTVEKGREQGSDFKLVAKALARIGNCYVKKGSLELAIKYFNKSLSEHRTPEILARLKEIEKEKNAQEKAAYCDPAVAEEERALGNELFKKGEFSEALKHYAESIRRDDTDARGYSNRAACYAKLAAFPEAIKDCDSCLRIDPTFVKGYLRKAGVYFSMKEYQKCMDACFEASEHDKEGKYRSEIEQQLSRCYAENVDAQSGDPQENLKKAMADPEIQRIVSDPAMQSILGQMQSDPRAIADHMRNPEVANKIRKLIAAGIIRTA